MSSSNRLKLDRASEHLARLEVLTHAVSDMHREASDARRGLDVTNGVYQGQLEQCSLVIGEILHNARSALDSLVFEIATKYSPAPLTDSQERALQFPITDTAQDFKSALSRGVLFSVPKPACDSIWNMQPCNSGSSSPARWLRILRDLSNRDKHRQVNVVWHRTTVTSTAGGQGGSTYRVVLASHPDLVVDECMSHIIKQLNSVVTAPLVLYL
jgi:hypothetical protein